MSRRISSSDDARASTSASLRCAYSATSAMATVHHTPTMGWVMRAEHRGRRKSAQRLTPSWTAATSSQRTPQCTHNGSCCITGTSRSRRCRSQTDIHASAVRHRREPHIGPNEWGWISGAPVWLAAADGTRIAMLGKLLPTGALTMLAPRPAARSTLALLQFLLGAANASFARLLLLRILDPADELIAREGRDVLPRGQRRVVADQRRAQIGWQLVHDTTRHSRAVHHAKIIQRGSGGNDLRDQGARHGRRRRRACSSP
jgi:hypothetical protein